MPLDSLTPLAERILLTVWKLNAIGARFVSEDSVRAELSVAIDELTKEIQNLYTQGFLSKTTINEKTSISLTALGLAILRQIEEDKLQELK
jgi:RIO-like serine/threonine protein kinase